MRFVCLISLSIPFLLLQFLVADGRRAKTHQVAERLVRKALQAELDGDNAVRTALLDEALREAPDYAPARWLTGHVMVDRRWYTLDEAEQLAAQDTRISEYRRLSYKHKGTLQDELALARWCRKQGLEFEAKKHWGNVLRIAPNHKESMRESGVRWHEGELLTHEQIAERKQAMKTRNDWKPRLEKWRRAIEGTNATARDTAIAELRKVSDPDAIPAMEEFLSSKSSQLGLEVVSLLGRTKDYQATESLVRHAVLSQYTDVRQSATELLEARPLHDFVPLLLDNMTLPLELDEFKVTAVGDTLEYHYVVQVEDSDEKIIMHSRVLQPYLVRGRGNPERMANRLLRNSRNDARRAQAAVSRRLESANASTAQQNERIQQVLYRTTEQNLGQNPTQWWSWWNDHNDQIPPEEKQERFASQSVRRSTQVVNGSQSCECFARGTRVWTQTGRIPIEQIQMGDRVLSQDPETGELAYKPVMGVTVRPPSVLRKLTLDNEEISTTAGHPMWVVGHGWRMVKRLEVGQRLHSIKGTVTIKDIDKGEKGEAYNLIVADFGTYLVGGQGILVHDTSSRQPTLALVPGLRDES